MNSSVNMWLENLISEFGFSAIISIWFFWHVPLQWSSTGHIPVANSFSLTAVLLFRQHFVVPEFNVPSCGSYTKDVAQNCKYIPSWAGLNCKRRHLQRVLAGLKRSLSPVLLCPCTSGPNSLTFSLPSSSHAGCSCPVMRRQAKEHVGKSWIQDGQHWNEENCRRQWAVNAHAKKTRE